MLKGNMRHPNKSKVTFKCGHRGNGGFCHRCRQADEAEKRGTKEDKIEAKRLREVSK